MRRALDSLIDTVVHRRALRRWRTAAEVAPQADAAGLHVLRKQARLLRRQVDRFLYAAEGQLALRAADLTQLPGPEGADWTWRPEPWCRPLPVPGIAPVPPRCPLVEGTSLFHDCADSGIAFRQLRTPDGAAPFALRLDILHFGGSFLSFAIDLPEEALQGLTRHHLIRVEGQVETERPLERFLRLNVRHGPNTEHIVRELPPDRAQLTLDFDLAFTRVNEKRIEKAWLDIIFEAPDMNQIVIRDVTLSRRPRAEF